MMNTFERLVEMFRFNIIILSGMMIWFVLRLAANLPPTPEEAALVFGLSGVVVGGVSVAMKDLMAAPPPVEVPIEAHREVLVTNRYLTVDKEILLAESDARKAEAEARIAEAQLKLGGPKTEK